MTTGYLEHFGIKGMHWGIRHDKEYEKKRRNSRNAKAKKYEDKSKQLQTKIDDIKNQLKITSPNSYKYYTLYDQMQTYQRQKDYNDRTAKQIKEGKLTRNQKLAITAAVLVAAYATYKVVDSGVARQTIEKGRSLIEHKDYTSFKTKPSLSSLDLNPSEIQSQVVSRINPNYGEFGTKMNCRRCTLAYEMSRRGYDVSATRSNGGTGQNIAGLWNAMNKKQMSFHGFVSNYKKGESSVTSFVNSAETIAKPFNPSIFASNKGYSQAIFDNLSQKPNHSRGELQVTWKPGGGHSIAWEIVNNKPVLFDCQNGKKYESPDDFEDVAQYVNQAFVRRLDNVDLNQDFLLRWLKNAN